MQFHLNGFEPGDPEIANPAQRYPASGAQGALPAEVDVLIVGCGPAGLTLATQLAAFPDIKTAIVEQKSGPLLRGQADIFAAAPLMVAAVNAVMALPFALRVIRPASEAAAARHDRLCASLGIAGWNRLRLVDWPALRRPALTGFAFAMALSLGSQHPAPLGVVVGMVLLISGLAFKISAVPFHMWTPDVYEGAPTSVTAFMALAPKVAALALMTRVFMGPFAHMIEEWRQVVIVISIASMALGSIAAIGQKNIKRLLAYSSIGNMGYALVGLAAGNAEGVKSVMIYVAIYMVTSVGAFAIVLMMKQKDRMVEDISDLAGLGQKQPMLALAMTLMMFSMAGIPPLAGFFSKLFVFQAAIGQGLYTLSVIGVLTSVIGAYYYLRIIKVMYFDEAGDEGLDQATDPRLNILLGVSSVVVLLFIAAPGALLTSADRAAQSLVAAPQ